MEAEQQKVKYLPFSFEGSGKEYFRIWIVNIALTILTLGIYSAWAKVRTNRYFYANTYLNGSNFEYNADPKRILIGRLVVVGIYIIFMVFFKYLGMFEVAGGIAIVALLAMPWLIRQAVSFKLRNTSYRNVPFRYTGRTRDFYKFFLITLIIFVPVIVLVMIGIPILSMIILFFFSASVYVKFKNLIINSSYYGNGKFLFDGKTGDVYNIYFKVSGWMILFFAGIITAVMLIAFAGKAISGGYSEEVISQVITMPSETISTETISFETNSSESYDEEVEMDSEDDGLFVGLISIFMLLVYLPILFLQKGLTDGYHSNFVRNNTRLHTAPLKGDINPLKMAWISATNILAIIFSLGILYPWTKVRYIKYKLEHTYFRCADYEQFESHGYVTGSTVGEETVDFFDIDIGL